VSRIIVEGPRSFHVAQPAELLLEDEGKEVAWARPHVESRPDFGWVLGRFVEADKANSNGHVFGLEDLKRVHASIPSTPLNMLHRSHHVVGTFAATNLITPEVEAAGADGLNAYVEALAAFWRWVFPDEYRAVRAAFDAGSAWYSMEAVPETLTCMDPACGQVVAYRGTRHDTYCAHLNAHRSAKTLNNPLFVGGAMIIPPVRPGWKRADITELASLIEGNMDRAAALYEQVAERAPHLDSAEWEGIMAELLVATHDGPMPLRARTWAAAARLRDLATCAMDDGGFPIEDAADLEAALVAFPLAARRAETKRHIITRAAALGLGDALPLTWEAPVAAETTPAPPEVLHAYVEHLEDHGFELDDPPAPTATARAVPSGTLWQLADGWGEWYFLAESDTVTWVAQKMADVGAFASSEAAGITRADVKALGWGDAAWLDALATRLGAATAAATAALEADAGPRGAIVALVPPAEVRDALAALGTEAPEELHVTLVFLGDIDDETDAIAGVDLSATFAAVGAFAAGAPPLAKATVSGLGRFALDDGEVTYASVDAPGLAILRERLVAALAAAGIPMVHNHGFTPHISLAYHAPGAGPVAMPEVASWPVGTIELWWSGAHYVFDLAGGRVDFTA
jgi:2'-5' RNA ligase